MKWFSLRGGVGGLASGYVFGLQLSTFLALLAPAVSSSAPLSPSAFFAIWILCCSIATIFGGLYLYCALLFSGIIGGASLALATSVMVHPPLGARQVLVPLLSSSFPVVILLTCIPRLSHFLRPASRVATASSGAFNLVISIALLNRVGPWENVWERLWISDGHGWGTSRESGLSAAYCIFLGIGLGADWALNRWLGECPDEKWDHCLASYTSDLPNDTSRAGKFRPIPPSYFSRFFRSRRKAGIHYPSDGKPFWPLLASPPKDLSFKKFSFSDSLEELPYVNPSTGRSYFKELHTSSISPPKKAKTRKTGRTPPVKFGTSSDSSDDGSDTAYSPNPLHDNTQHRNLSMRTRTPTFVADGGPDRAFEMNQTKIVPGVMEYSDDDMKVPTQDPLFKEAKESSAWPASGNLQTSGLFASLAAVPATPSLIKAIDRVSAAQLHAYSIQNTIPFTTGESFTPNANGTKVTAFGINEEIKAMQEPQWDDFWKDVRRKAGS